MSPAVAIVTVVVVCGVSGWVFGDLAGPFAHSHKLPWIVARATGLGAVIALGALNATGLLFRRPARRATRASHPEALLRLHVALGPAVVGLLSAHVVSLLADRYSGVVWKSLVVPGAAHYRPGAVALGTLAAELIVVVALSAALAGRPGVRARWAPLHHLAHPAFVLAWVHGVLAGSDTPALRGLYVVVGLVVGLAALPLLTRPSVLRRPAAQP